MINLFEEDDSDLMNVHIDVPIAELKTIFRWFVDNEIVVYEPFERVVEVDMHRMLGFIESMLVWEILPYIRVRLHRLDAYKLRLQF